jgi:hypothetical protein
MIRNVAQGTELELIFCNLSRGKWECDVEDLGVDGMIITRSSGKN